MTNKRTCAAVLVAAAVMAVGGLFVANEANAHESAHITDINPTNTVGANISHSSPSLSATVYAGVDIAGNDAATSFTIGWTSYAPGYRVWVHNNCIGLDPADRSAWITSAYDAVLSLPCVSAAAVVNATGWVSH